MRAASQCGVSPEAVQDEVRQQRRRRAAAARRQTEREELRPLRMSQPQERGIQYKNPRSAAAEEGVIRLLNLDPSLFRGVGLAEADFSSPELWRIYSALRRRADEGAGLPPAAMSGELSPEEFSLFTSVIQKPESAANAPRALADYIAIMRAADKAEGDLLAFQDRMKKTKSYGG